LIYFTRQGEQETYTSAVLIEIDIIESFGSDSGESRNLLSFTHKACHPSESWDLINKFLFETLNNIAGFINSYRVVMTPQSREKAGQLPLKKETRET
jgi:hypothetical protein